MLSALIPIIAGILATVAVWHCNLLPSFPDLAAVMAFGGTVASISSTMLGFILAALAILASVNDTHLIRMMRVYGHYNDLLKTMLRCMLYFLGCAVLGLILLFGLPFTKWLGSVLIGLHVVAFCSLFGVGRKLWLVLRNLGVAKNSDVETDSANSR